MNGSKKKKQDDGANRCVGNRRDDTSAEVHIELGQQPGADERADYSDDEVADEPEACALHDLPSEPASNDADYHDDEKTFARHMHARVLQV
jgi:hypothetical protein